MSATRHATGTGPTAHGDPPGGATRFLGVLGEPVRHSLSPRLHNAAFAALGLDWAYGAFPVRPANLAAAVQGARALGFVGLSVTMPHKQAVARIADQVSRTVSLLGAANTVAFAGGVVQAASTDGDGLLADLASAGFDPAGRSAVVLGAGGAARAAVLALAEAGASVVVVNRSPDRARAAAALAGASGRVGGDDELAGADLVVKATPLGMPGPGAAPGTGDDPGTGLGARCGAGQLVVDLVYHPPATPFLEAAAAAGATVRNGLGMLVHQAGLQVEWWTHEPAPLEAMWAAVSPDGA